jgi:hypothetical protein
MPVPVPVDILMSVGNKQQILVVHPPSQCVMCLQWFLLFFCLCNSSSGFPVFMKSLLLPLFGCDLAVSFQTLTSPATRGEPTSISCFSAMNNFHVYEAIDRGKHSATLFTSFPPLCSAFPSLPP